MHAETTRATSRTAFALAACLVFVAWFWVRGERFLAANGPTFDEGVHLTAGYGYWTTGDFKLNPEHPPLLKLLWSLPLLFTDAPPYPRELASAAKPNHWHIANAFIYESCVPPRSLFDPARRVNLALGCGLVLLVGWVAYRVWGLRLAGVAGCGFAASDPTLLALSCVLTTDIGLSLFGFLTCYLLWEYVTKPSRGLLVAVGISLGLTLAAKFSAIGIVVGLVVAGVVFMRFNETPRHPVSDASAKRPESPVFRVVTLTVLTVAATYAFVHFPEWGKGLKFQLTRGGHGDGVAYLNGEISRTGWYHYFLVAVPLKLPLGLLLAASVSAVSLLLASRGCERPGSGSRLAFLVIPPLVFFALASFSRVNVGVRAVYPCVPFLYLLAAGLAVSQCRRVVLVLCLGWCLVAVQRANPYEVSFFNELGGANQLADSNLDWGQGLPALKDWMNANGVDVIYLGYFGTDRPEAHDIRFQPLPGYGRAGSPGGEAIPADAPRHILAVSANHLRGLFLNEPETYSWLRGQTPTATVGGCIHVFELTDDPAAIARVRGSPQR